MIRMVAISALSLLAACTPYEAEPNSPIQWQRRQEAIERTEAERVRLCGTVAQTNDRHARECRRPTQDHGRYISNDAAQCAGEVSVSHNTVVEKYPNGTCLVEWFVAP